jgi:hypothetical protein
MKGNVFTIEVYFLCTIVVERGARNRDIRELPQKDNKKQEDVEA